MSLLKLNLNKKSLGAVLALLLAVPASGSLAGTESPVIRLTLKGHRFAPQRIVVPPGVKFKLVISNEDQEPAEFESFALHREQMVMGRSEAVLFLGPLKVGKYEFFDDFRPETRGWLEAAAQAGASR